MNNLKKILLLLLVWYPSSKCIMSVETAINKPPYEFSSSHIGGKRLAPKEHADLQNKNIVNKEIERVKEYRDLLLEALKEENPNKHNFDDDSYIQEYDSRIKELKELLSHTSSFNFEEIRSKIEDINIKYHPEQDK